ncbi:FadR/GntR family transcriptional regulator [Arenibaculum pallidiluteum]|uniref:FadR/GntR family transcriptional regulator n=1 Tax=Arenibaculum pallidiluteum TaxID=2812559 RepID=UPI001A95905C|nr:FadR/GntR family transcriptional regulator [Arenibaculum pallidiluteum]
MTATIERPEARGLVDQVMHAVIDHIRGNGLLAGAALPGELAFARDLGVSRAIVREAFRSLTTLGIIDVGNGRRARVSALDDEVLALVLDHAVYTNQVTVQQVFDFRRVVEIRAAGLAAVRRTERESEQISGYIEAMRTDFEHAEKMMEHDIAFHTAIARASRNPMFGMAIGSLRLVLHQTWPVGWRGRRTDAQRHDQILIHEAVAKAIAAQDAVEAERAMDWHFENSIRVLVNVGLN